LRYLLIQSKRQFNPIFSKIESGGMMSA